MTLVALVTDLMDQSRIRAALPDVTFTRDPATAAEAEVVIVELTRFGDRIAEVRALTSGRIVAFGSHVDTDAFTAARDAGADSVLARSRFFADPVAAVTAK